MSETSVDQRWCAVHGMTRVKRVATLAPFPHVGEMTTSTLEWWECPHCIAAAPWLPQFKTEFKCETCKVTVGSVTEIDRLRAENAALSQRVRELEEENATLKAQIEKARPRLKVLPIEPPEY